MNFLRYGVVFAGVAIGVGFLVSLLNATGAGLLGSSAQLMVPAMIAAVIEGQRYARANRRKPAGGVAWNFTWVATAIAVALNLALAYLAAGVLPEFGKLAISPVFSQQFNVLLGLYAGAYLFCNRFFLSIGAGNQLSLMRSRGEIE